MEPTIFIPTNYTDAGKLLGMFEIRNVVECACLCIPISLLCILLSPFGLTGTIILIMVLDISVGGFALIGIQDYSLLTFLRIYKRYKRFTSLYQLPMKLQDILFEGIILAPDEIHVIPEKPSCYNPETDNPYPLCVGNGSDACKSCCLYVDLDYNSYE